MSEFPPPLPYESSSRIESDSITWIGRQVQIDLGPMPAGAFFAVILPSAVWLVVSLAMVLMFAVAETPPCLSIIFAVAGIVPLWSLISRCVDRSNCRTIWATPAEVAFRDPRTGRVRKTTVFDHPHLPANVSRDMLMPWVFTLSAYSNVSHRTFGRASPIVLAIDTDRARLEKLLPTIEKARAWLADEAHVRGAFEVVLPVVPIKDADDRGRD